MEFVTSRVCNRVARNSAASRLTAPLFAVLLASCPAGAQDSELAGFVLANAVTSNQPISAKFSGRPVLSEAGLRSGSATSGLGVPVGSGFLEVTHPELGAAELSLEISVGKTPIVVAYEETELPKAAGEMPRRKLALREVASRPDSQNSGKGFFDILYAVAPNAPPLGCELNNSPVQLAPWRSHNISGSSLLVTIAGKEVASETMDEAGRFYAFISRSMDGEYLVSLVPQIIYRW